MSAIPVVCAIIEHHHLVLVAQRPVGKHLPLKWEFPGGKVEANELAEAAIVRELREELGCDAEILQALPRFEFDYRTALIEMIPFVCRLAAKSPAPTAIEHVALRWLAPSDVATLDLAPADFPVLESYLKSVGARR